MSSELRDSREARKRTKGLVGAAGIFAAVAVIVLAVVLLAPMIQSETGDQSQDGGSVTVTYSIGDYGSPNNAYNIISDVDSSVTVQYLGVPVAEYNPQFWEGSIVGKVLSVTGSDDGSVQDWLKIFNYPRGRADRLTVFSGWEVFNPAKDRMEIVDPGTDLSIFAVSGSISLEAKWSKASWIWHTDRSPTGNRATDESAKYRNIILLYSDVDDLGTLRYRNVSYNQDTTIRSSGTTKSVIDANNKQAGSNLIIDNVKLKGADRTQGNSGLGDHGNGNGLYGSGSLIIGTGVENVAGTYVQVLGGINQDTASISKLTIFSGTYEIVAGGTFNGDVSGTELVLAGSYNGDNLRVNGSVYGGNTGEGDIGSTKVLIAGGMVSDGEMYTIPSNGKYQTVIGGNRNSGEIGSAEVILTGKASAFMVQGGGRSPNVIIDTTNVTISGAARVFYMACGSVTDGNEGNRIPVMTSNVTLKDSAVIGQPDTTNGLLLGGGWDTYSNPVVSSTRATNVFVQGGTVYGSVYGGGFRGPVGTGADTTVQVKISGGEIHGSVYGGGRGGPDPIGGGSGASNPTGYAYIYGSVSLEISGGEILGSVHGGGEGATGGETDVAWVDGDIGIRIFGGKVHGSVYGGGKGFPASGGSGADIAKVTGDIVVTVQGSADVSGSVYGGGAYGRVIGKTDVSIAGGSVGVNVFGGGLGEYSDPATVYAVDGPRSVGMTGGSVGASIYGSSSFGDDIGSSTVSVSGGTVSGSVYGGGLKGRTHGSTEIEISGTANVHMSVYGGGDIGDTSGDGREFNTVLVTGDSAITVDGASGASVGGSIFGSGNSCRIGGTANIIIDRLTADSMESIQNADSVKLISSHVHLTGRSDGSTSEVSSKYSLNNIVDLRIIAGTHLGMEASVGSLGGAGSYIVDNVPSTPSSPTNTVRLVNGAVLGIRDGDGNYSNVTGYAILSLDANQTYYGALAYGSTGSPGGFVVNKGGDFVAADTSDLTDECRCWFIAGATKMTKTVVAKHGETEQTLLVDPPTLTPDTTIVYLGHSAEGDRLELTGDVPVGQGMFRLTVGHSGDLSFEDGPITPTGSASYVQKAATSTGDKKLGLRMEHHSIQNYTGHAGYVTLRFWEAVQVTVDGESRWVAQNRIDLELDIRTESSSAGFGGGYDLRIETRSGDGSAGFVIPRSFNDYTVEIRGYAGPSMGTLYIEKSYNDGSTIGWALPPSGRSPIAAGAVVGTLNGPFEATMTISAVGVAPGSTATLTMVLVPPNGGMEVTFTINVMTVDAGTCVVTFVTRQMEDGAWTRYETTIAIPKGQPIPVSEIPETGANFTGWYLDDPDSVFNPVGLFDLSSPVNGDITLYACYRWTVTFVPGNGTTSVLSLPVRQGGIDIGKPADPVRTGYDFQNWVRENGDDAFVDGSSEHITGDTTFRGEWVGKSVVVTYRYDGWTGQRTYEYGQTYGEGMDEASASLSTILVDSALVGWKLGDRQVFRDTDVAYGDHVLEAIVTEQTTFLVKLRITVDGVEVTGKRVWLRSDSWDAEMTYDSDSGYYSARVGQGSYGLLVERTHGGNDAVIGLDIVSDYADVRTIALYTVTLKGNTDGVIAPELASEGRTVTVSVPKGSWIEKVSYMEGGTERIVDVRDSSFSMPGHQVSVHIFKDIVEAEIKVYDPPRGSIKVRDGGTLLEPSISGDGFSVYKVEVGHKAVFEYILESDESLYRWMLGGVEKAPAEGNLDPVTGDAVVFAVFLLEGEKETADYTEISFSKLIARSDDCSWTADWGPASFDGFSIPLEQYGYKGLELTIAPGSISISGLGGLTGTVDVRGVVAEIGGTLYSIDVLVRIVPHVSQGEVSQ